MYSPNALGNRVKSLGFMALIASISQYSMEFRARAVDTGTNSEFKTPLLRH